MSVLKKILLVFVGLIVIAAGFSCSLADAIMPLADDVFDATKVDLSPTVE